jgi:RimJ/RimL family protein N-acetyltransferase
MHTDSFLRCVRGTYSLASSLPSTSDVDGRPWTAGLPVLAGELVDIREIITSDASALFDLLSDPRVTQHLASPPPDVRAFEGFIAWAQRERSAGNGVCFGIEPHGLQQAVGLIQVRALEPSFGTSEWGFAIGAAFWGTGVFMDAANLVAQYAFEVLGTRRLEGRAVMKNGRGNGALQKIGATPEASLSRAFRRPNGYDAQLLWTLTHEDWQQRPLIMPPFSASDATARIACAIATMKESLGSTRPTRCSEVPPLYPFFLTTSHRYR